MLQAKAEGCEFKASHLGYIVRLHLKKEEKKPKMPVEIGTVTNTVDSYYLEDAEVGGGGRGCGRGLPHSQVTSGHKGSQAALGRKLSGFQHSLGNK